MSAIASVGPMERERPSALLVDAVREPRGFAALREEWNQLLADSDAGPFCAWEWLYPWHMRIGGDRQLWILTARDSGGALVGLLPLGIERIRFGPRVLRRLAFLGETHVGSDYLDVIARRGLREEISARFIDVVRNAARREWDVLELVDISRESSTLEALRRAFPGPEFGFELRDRFICPFEPLRPGTSFDAFLKQTGRRENYLRRRRWLERQPSFRIECTTSPEALARPLTEFFRLHHLRWAADGGSQGIRGPAVEAFHRDATEYLAERGRLRLYTLELSGRALASVYGIVDRGRFVYFQSGYDPAWRARSVGLVLVGETFRDALANDLTEYDFLRGTESYKAEWTSQQRQTVAARIWPTGGPGEWLVRVERADRAARNLVKRALPAPVLASVRRWRRRLSARAAGGRSESL